MMTSNDVMYLGVMISDDVKYPEVMTKDDGSGRGKVESRVI